MENLTIEATKYTPEIVFDVTGKLSIKGKSYPENTFEFYAPVMNWTKTYLSTDSSPKELTLDIEITYFNSSSSKLLLIFSTFLMKTKPSLKSPSTGYMTKKTKVRLKRAKILSKTLKISTSNSFQKKAN
jgi:hypothetical protein